MLVVLEMYRVKHGIAPKIMFELFNEANVLRNLRQDLSFYSYSVKTFLSGTETLSYLGPTIWNLVPLDIRDWATPTEPIFRQKIKTWNPDSYTSRLCKIYIHNLGFYLLKIALRRSHMCTEMFLIFRLVIL